MTTRSQPFINRFFLLLRRYCFPSHISKFGDLLLLFACFSGKHSFSLVTQNSSLMLLSIAIGCLFGAHLTISQQISSLTLDPADFAVFLTFSKIFFAGFIFLWSQVNLFGANSVWLWKSFSLRRNNAIIYKEKPFLVLVCAWLLRLRAQLKIFSSELLLKCAENHFDNLVGLKH